jgi:hypothetical protein
LLGIFIFAAQCIYYGWFLQSFHLITLLFGGSFVMRSDGPTVSALRRAIGEVKQCWLVIVWVPKNLFSRAPPCFERKVEPLIPAAVAVVSSHQPVLSPRGGLWPVLLICIIYKKGLCPSSGEINRLMIMMFCNDFVFCKKGRELIITMR